MWPVLFEDTNHFLRQQRHQHQPLVLRIVRSKGRTHKSSFVSAFSNWSVASANDIYSTLTGWNTVIFRKIFLAWDVFVNMDPGILLRCNVWSRITWIWGTTITSLAVQHGVLSRLVFSDCLLVYRIIPKKSLKRSKKKIRAAFLFAYRDFLTSHWKKKKTELPLVQHSHYGANRTAGILLSEFALATRFRDLENSILAPPILHFISHNSYVFEFFFCHPWFILTLHSFPFPRRPKA